MRSTEQQEGGRQRRASTRETAPAPCPPFSKVLRHSVIRMAVTAVELQPAQAHTAGPKQGNEILRGILRARLVDTTLYLVCFIIGNHEAVPPQQIAGAVLLTTSARNSGSYSNAPASSRISVFVPESSTIAFLYSVRFCLRLSCCNQRLISANSYNPSRSLFLTFRISFNASMAAVVGCGR